MNWSHQCLIDALWDIHLIVVFTVRFLFRVLRNLAIVSQNVFKRLRKTKKQYWEIYHSHLGQIESLLSKPNNPLPKWYTLVSYEYTLRSAATHYSTLYKTLQSSIFNVSIQFHRRHVFTTTKKSNTQYCTLQYGTLQCSKFSLSKYKTKINKNYTTVL